MQQEKSQQLVHWKCLTRMEHKTLQVFFRGTEMTLSRVKKYSWPDGQKEDSFIGVQLCNACWHIA